MVFVLLLAALFGGYALLPSIEEQAAMLLRNGDLELALAKLEAAYVGGDKRPRIVRQLAELRTRSGQPEQATALLQSHLAINPNDGTAREQLAAIWLVLQQPADHVRELAEAHVLAPSASTYRKLLALYRRDGNFEAEQRLVSSDRSADYVRDADLERAAGMLASRGLLGEAANLLRLYDRRAPRDIAVGRLLLCDVLLDDGKADEAAQLAARWIKSWRSPWLTVSLVQRFAAAGLAGHAVQLIGGAREILPGIEAVAVSVMTTQGNPIAVQHILGQWATHLADADPGAIEKFVGAAIASGDPATPLEVFAGSTANGATPKAQVALAEYLALQYGFGAVAGLVQTLPRAALARRPVFAAELASFEGNPAAARLLLDAVDPAAVSPAQRARWLALQRKLKPDGQLFKELHARWHERRLPDDLKSELAELALLLGNVDIHVAVRAEAPNPAGTGPR
jgi:tetratricopeptide (TPR) repeat protein